MRRLVLEITQRLIDDVSGIRRPKHHNRFADIFAGAEIPTHTKAVIICERIGKREKMIRNTAAKLVNRLVGVADYLGRNSRITQPLDYLQINRIAVLCLINDDFAEPSRKRGRKPRGEVDFGAPRDRQSPRVIKVQLSAFKEPGLHL